MVQNISNEKELNVRCKIIDIFSVISFISDCDKVPTEEGLFLTFSSLQIRLPALGRYPMRNLDFFFQM